MLFRSQILKYNNKAVATIGTLGVISQKFKLKTDNTTIDPLNIHKTLKQLKKLNINNVIIEASSHGLKQHRLDGLLFDIGIFTNLSHDHLDYHKTIQNYHNSKINLIKKHAKENSKILVQDSHLTKKINPISKNIIFQVF